ncbi:4-hydroxyphenylpyruvate dioxygenase C domain protein [Propionibacterium freudenreichii]|uniref:methylmalonyl-CoA epimerase n=1 Tax=Propionibacterium freudenreichii TaxID=1744 RepID=UPI0005A5C380|nr:methylmalonyl-CoA epimerase [Propionibacterium freudenreichii]CEI29693.1 Methylmalonyl-CoA epimerase [Propionibacterium freudenreichii]SBN60106.1 4-hydroxyphenylpyruvate dioxygenase C domain protein [Propionibacterium freudenreichii]SCQ48568.1 4-hydroxyphenylpyruvate dioxygenase C domain protein [Propionibacterium freudenreichii]SCQ53655.1 4-hydroxyphenylpyruvate dioxygenase C domain protein [Propionibacterium freudenreichii]
MSNEDLFICIDHVAYACPDADEASKYYQETFGWHELHREENPEQGVVEIMMAPAAKLTKHMTQVQVMAPLNDESTVAKWLAKHNGRAGLHHMAWRVDDIDAVSATLRERGVQLLYDEPKLGTGGNRINFMHPKSGKGVLIELTQYPKN